MFREKSLEFGRPSILIILHCGPEENEYLISHAIRLCRAVGNVSDCRPTGHEIFVEIDHEIISTVILPSADSFKKDCCKLQVNVCA